MATKAYQQAIVVIETVTPPSSNTRDYQQAVVVVGRVYPVKKQLTVNPVVKMPLICNCAPVPCFRRN